MPDCGYAAGSQPEEQKHRAQDDGAELGTKRRKSLIFQKQNSLPFRNVANRGNFHPP
jgi:hypothetical protein